MTDLDELFGPLIDESAPRRVPVDQIETRARAYRKRERRRHRGQGFVAGVAAIALVVGAVAFARGGDSESVPPAHSAPTTTTPVRVPAGWTSVDFGLARLSIPDGWSPQSGCPGGYSLGLTGQGQSVYCGNPGSLPSIQIEALSREPGQWTFSPNRRVNGFPYQLVVRKCACATIDIVRVKALNVAITFNNVPWRPILRTLTYSAYARVVEQPFGPTPASWKTETFDGLSLRVPASWAVHGAHESGPCTAEPNSVYLGTPTSDAGCPFMPARGDWAWLRPVESNDPTLGALSHNPRRYRGLLVAPEREPAPTFDSQWVAYVVGVGTRVISLDLGVGQNPAIARGILGSLRPVG